MLLKAPSRRRAQAPADGRRLGGAALAAARGRATQLQLPADVVPVHDDFRLWVPRTGRASRSTASTFRDCGDAFAAMQLDNADFASETNLLEQRAAPRGRRARPRPAARAHAAAARGRVAELRALAEGGALAYPYSMREAVAVARHSTRLCARAARRARGRGRGRARRGAGRERRRRARERARVRGVRRAAARAGRRRVRGARPAREGRVGAPLRRTRRPTAARRRRPREIEPIDICAAAPAARALSPLVGREASARACALALPSFSGTLARAASGSPRAGRRRRARGSARRSTASTTRRARPRRRQHVGGARRSDTAGLAGAAGRTA